MTSAHPMTGLSFNGCSGWLHPAEGRRGVVMCSAHGFEELCARASWRTLADTLAGAGLPTLRFDYPGTGDALDLATDSGHVAAWLGSIHEAIEALRAATGVSEVVLVGLRIGGTLATLASQQRSDIAGLALLAPSPSGRLYVREQRALARIVSPPLSHHLKREVGEGVDVCGFTLSPAQIAELERLDLASGAGALPGDVLLMRQPGAASQKAVASRLTALGGTLTQVDFAGFEAMVCDPTAASIPHADLAKVAAWCAQTAPREHGVALPSPPCAPARRGGAFTEVNVVIDAARPLAGVLCEPSAGRTRRGTILFLNAGMNYHIGWARMTVAHARALAAEGYASLRIDLSGIGDSAPARPDAQPCIYTQTADDDTLAAIGWLEARGHDTPTLYGACSGAYSAFHVARTAARVRHAIVVNLQCFAWTPLIGYQLDSWKAYRQVEVAAQKVSAEDDATPLRRLRARLSHEGARRFRQAGKLVQLIAARIPGRRKEPESVAERHLNAMSQRGVRLDLIYSAGDTGIAELERQCGRVEDVRRLPGLSVEIVPEADHNMTPAAARNHLLALIVRHLDAEAARKRAVKSELKEPAAALTPPPQSLCA